MAQPAETFAANYREAIQDAVADDRIDEALNGLQDFVRDLAPRGF